MRDAWTPISDAERLYDVSNQSVVNHFNFPVGTDTERILVNTRRLERLTRFAGAKQVILAGADLGLEKPDMYDIQDIGGGMAAAKGLKKHPKERMNASQYDDTNNPVQEIPFLDLKMPLNEIRPAIKASYKADSVALFMDPTGLARRVRDHKKNKKSTIDESVWSTVLDKEIRSGLLIAASERYIADHKYWKFLDPLLSLMLYQNIVEYVSDGEGAFSAGLAITFKGIQVIGGARHILMGNAEWRDHNWTTQIYSTVRTDRLIATAIVAKAGGRVVKVAK